MNAFRKKTLQFFGAVVLLGLTAACPGGTEQAPEIRVHTGELNSPRGKDFTYVDGDVINAKTVSIDYLKGDVRGEKIRNLWIHVMEGTVANGPVTINVLKGNIIDGDGVTVNLLIGEDFSGQAQIGKKITAGE